MQSGKFELPIGEGKARQIVTVERYPKGRLHTLKITARGVSMYFNDVDEQAFRREVFVARRPKSHRSPKKKRKA